MPPDRAAGWRWFSATFREDEKLDVPRPRLKANHATGPVLVPTASPEKNGPSRVCAFIHRCLKRPVFRQGPSKADTLRACRTCSSETTLEKRCCFHTFTIGTPRAFGLLLHAIAMCDRRDCSRAGFRNLFLRWSFGKSAGPLRENIVRQAVSTYSPRGADARNLEASLRLADECAHPRTSHHSVTAAVERRFATLAWRRLA
jgi:hypothetical protein